MGDVGPFDIFECRSRADGAAPAPSRSTCQERCTPVPIPHGGRRDRPRRQPRCAGPARPGGSGPRKPSGPARPQASVRAGLATECGGLGSAMRGHSLRCARLGASGKERKLPRPPDSRPSRARIVCQGVATVNRNRDDRRAHAPNTCRSTQAAERPDPGKAARPGRLTSASSQGEQRSALDGDPSNRASKWPFWHYVARNGAFRRRWPSRKVGSRIILGQFTGRAGALLPVRRVQIVVSNLESRGVGWVRPRSMRWNRTRHTR